MSKKVKGFTLLETIITVTIMVIVLAVVSSVFMNSKKLMIKTELKSQMQEEGEKFQKSIVTYGTQAVALEIKRGTSIDVTGWTIGDYKTASTDGYLDISSISFLLPNGVNGDTNLTVGSDEYLLCKMSYESIGTGKNAFVKRIDKVELTSPTPTVTPNFNETTMSKNLYEVNIIPLNWQEIKSETELTKSLLDEMTGLKVTAKFKKKQGNIEVEYEVSSIVKFRNK